MASSGGTVFIKFFLRVPVVESKLGLKTRFKVSINENAGDAVGFSAGKRFSLTLTRFLLFTFSYSVKDLSTKKYNIALDSWEKE